MGYRYRDDIAKADAAFEVWGESLGELFGQAGDALMNVMVGDLDTIEQRESKTIELVEDGVEMLLFARLEELVFYKDAEQLLLRVNEVEIREAKGRLALRAEAAGEKIDAARHELVVDVKAVTMHRFRVEGTDQGWEATVVVDI